MRPRRSSTLIPIRLRPAPNDAFARLRVEADSAAPTVRAADLMWMLTLGGVFLAIHLGRMPISDTLLGIVSPFVATAGDILMTLVFAIACRAAGAAALATLHATGRTAGMVVPLGTRTRSGSRVNPAADWLICTLA